MEMNIGKVVFLLGEAFFQTFYMVFISGILALLLGFPLGIIIHITNKNGLKPKPLLNKILNFFVNILRSLPFVILMVVLVPMTRFVVGTSIGSTAAIIPLFVLASPFVARLVDSCLLEVPKELVETSKILGASTSKIIFDVLLAESLPSLINVITITIINLLGASAMAGAIGGGGIGDLAIRYGYQRFETKILIASVLLILLIVQSIQITGDFFSKLVKRKRGLLIKN